jgi:multiple sugar transport system ATP-binding protein
VPVTVEAVGLTKTFPGSQRPAVDHVDLATEEGEYLVLLGPSGCGKTTLLRMIAGLEQPTEGEIRIGGRVVNDFEPPERDIAMVFQNYALYPHMTVRDNIGFPLQMQRLRKAEIDRRVTEAARLLGIEELLKRKPRELSGGQRQRVAMGRAIVREPQAFLMDEPLSNLDAKLRVSMRAQLSRLHERLGVTTVYVTHDQVEAMTLGQRVAVLRGGVLQQCATPEVLFEHPANLFVAAFIGSPAMNLVEATVSDGEARFGSCRVPLAPGSPLRGRIVLGVRPHDLKLGASGIAGRVQVVERLGTETHVVVGIDAPRLRSRVLSEAVDAAPDDDVLLAEDDRASFTVVTEARTPVAVGDAVELGLDPARLHGFDAETGEAVSSASVPRTGAPSPDTPVPTAR